MNQISLIEQTLRNALKQTTCQFLWKCFQTVLAVVVLPCCELSRIYPKVLHVHYVCSLVALIFIKCNFACENISY